MEEEAGESGRDAAEARGRGKTHVKSHLLSPAWKMKAGSHKPRDEGSFQMVGTALR